MDLHAAVDRASLTNFDVRAAAPRKSAQAQQKTAHEKLKQAVPSVAVDFDPMLNTPKWVHARGGFLTGENGEGKSVSAETAKKFDRDPDKALKGFLHEQRDLFRHGPEVLGDAKKTREHETKVLRTVAWEQQVDGIPVMDSILVAHTTARGELISISSLFVPEPAAAAEKGTPNRAAKIRKPGVSAEQALRIAVENLGEVIEEVIPVDAPPNTQVRKQKFNIKPLPGDASAGLVWLPLDGETLRLGWDVEVTRREQGERFRLVIDAETGTILLRRKLTVEVSDVLYRVYTSDSPSPFSPGLSTITNIQPPLVPRQLLSISNISAVGSPLGWINDGVLETRGNNVDAHLDRDGDDRPDLPRVQGTTNSFGQRSFDFPLNLNQHPTNYSRASVAQLFYWCNWMHDRLYDLGFTESAGNFQKDNFGRGGMDNDVMLAQAQDGSGFNNANFTPAGDGSPGKVQMYLFNMASPFRDGDLDAEVILHEYAHGLTDRMVGGGVGIFQLQTAGMGEGWSDFYAEAMLTEFADEPDAYYPMGGYVTYLFNGLTANYYYGIRRYPYTTNLNANPLTFKDIDPLRASAHPGIPRNPIITSSGPEVHRQGEVWCSMLWDMRAFLLRKYAPTNAVDFTNANTRVLRYVTEGLRLSPPNPNFVQARDAILQAVRLLQGGSDTNEVWKAFARRGLGLSAIGPDSSTTVGVFEAYDTPMHPEFDVQPRDPISFSGLQGGPFVSSVTSYTVANASSSNVAWAAGENLPWLQLSTVSGVLASGASVDCIVSLTPLTSTLPVGIYSGTVFFTNVTRTQVLARAVSLTIQQSNAPPADALAVSPLNQLSLEGPPGGPFRLAGGVGTPERVEHLANIGIVTVLWNAFTTNSWLSITPTNDFVDPSEVRDVLISLSSNATSLAEGIYAGGVTFVNSNSGVTTTVPVELRIGRADYLTEEFGNGSFDLRNTTLTFTPDGSSNFYHVCRSAALKFPTDPTNGIKAPLGDDTYYPVTLAGNRRVSIFGTSSNTIQIGGNGNLTFDPVLVTNVFSGGLDAFFSAQRVAALYVDLNVVQGGSISYLELSDRLVVTYENVPEYFDADPNHVPNSNNAQIELFYDGRIQMTWLRVDATNAASCIAGLSRGNGRPADFVETDLSASEGCGEGVVLLLPLSVREGDGDRSGTIILTAPTTNDLYVILTSSDPNEIIVEDLIIIPQGESSYWFPLNVVDDGEADGTQPVTITASFPDYPDRKPLTASTFVDDAQSSGITLNVKPTGREGTILAAGGTVTSDETAVRPLRVSLFSENTNRVRVPSIVTIPAGQNSATFDIVFPDDRLIQDTQRVEITAFIVNWTGDSDIIRVADDESRELKLTLPAEVVEGQGPLLNAGRVTLSGLAPNNIVVSLQSELSTLISVPASVTINSGKSNVFFTVTVLNNDVTNGFDSLRISASAPGFLNTTGSIQIVDDERPSQAHTPTPQNFAVDVARDVILEWLVNSSAPASTMYDVYLSTNTNFAPLSPVASTTNHMAILPRHLNPETTYYWKVVARLNPFPSVESDVWQFTTTPLLFVFNPIASPQFTGESFPISVRALDRFGLLVTNYNGSLALTNSAPVKSPSTVVISEIDTGPLRTVEMVNVSDRVINVAGWKVVHYDFQTWPEPVATFTIPGPSLSPPGGLFSVRGLPPHLAPGNYPNFFFPTNILWSNNEQDNPVAVMLLDSMGNIVDFVCAFGANPALITNPAAVPLAQWSGAPVPANLDPAFTLQREGSQDSNRSNDWRIVLRSPNTNNVGLVRQFTNSASVAFTTQIPLDSFVSGVSTGLVTVLDPARGFTFGVVENSTTAAVPRTAISNPIDVFARNDVAVTLSAPDNVLIGDSFSYQVSVTNTGPDTAQAVTIHDSVSPNAALVSGNPSQGSCALSNGTIVCSLGPIEAGATATISVVAASNERGTVTNFVTISRNGPDGALANNGASALTTVTLPQVAVFDGTNSEPVTTSFMNFSVRLSAAYSRTCSVAYATSDGTATGGVDYQSTAGVLVFLPGVTNQIVSIPLSGDSLSESNETFFVTLSSSSNTDIIRPVGLGTITDNDPQPLLSLLDTTVVESDGIPVSATFTVQLNAPSGRNVSASYVTANGSALAGLDYLERYGTIFIPRGTTNGTITVPIIADTIPEPAKTFLVSLTSVGNAVTARGQAVGTILDNDFAGLDRFTFDVSPQSNHVAVPFTMTARDGNGAVANGFSGPVTLLASAAPRTVNIGTNSINWMLPLAASFHDARLQSIYLSNEVGAAGRIVGLSLDIVTTPAQTLSNFTIRVRHTPLERHLANVWESLGWVTVCQRDAQIVNTGWTHFAFSTPFQYNGRDNLMIDFSFDNSSFSSDGVCRSSATTGNRSLYLRTDSAYGPPTNWPLDGVGNNPAGLLISRVPNLRLRMDSGLPVSLIESNGFAGGVFSGAVRVPASDQNIILRAVDSEGHFGESAPFATIPLRINKVSLSGNEVSIRVATLAGNSYVLEAGPSTSGPWTVVSPAIVGSGGLIQFNYVPTSTLQFYRVRAGP